MPGINKRCFPPEPWCPVSLSQYPAARPADPCPANVRIPAPRPSVISGLTHQQDDTFRQVLLSRPRGAAGMYRPKPPTRELGLPTHRLPPGSTVKRTEGVSESFAPGLDTLLRRRGFSASYKAPVASPDMCQKRGQQGTGCGPRPAAGRHVFLFQDRGEVQTTDLCVSARTLSASLGAPHPMAGWIPWARSACTL